MAGWWYTYPSEKYEFVGWDDYSQYMENKNCSKPPTKWQFFFRNEPRKMGIPYGYLT
jgi:hypothetical protein